MNIEFPKIIVIFMIVWTIFFVGVELGQETVAQDTPYQQWEYSALVYSGEDAFVFTADLETNHALNEVLSAMNDDEMTIVAAMNVMGAEGWEYLATQDAGAGSNLYLFKRPVG